MPMTRVDTTPVTARINYGPDFYATVRDTFTVMRNILPFGGYAFYSFNDDGGLYATIREGLDEDRAAAGSRLLERVGDEALLVDGADSEFALVPECRWHAWIPLVINQRLLVNFPANDPAESTTNIGVLYTYSDKPITTGLVNMVTMIAVQAALVQINAQHAQLWRRLAGMAFEQVPIGIITMTWGGYLYTANQAAREIIGDIPAGKRMEDTHLAEHWPKLEKTIQQAVEQGRTAILEASWQAAHGAKIKLRFNVSVESKPGEYWLATITLEDVTARRQLEQALERANRLKDLNEMVSGAAHEIRNPLTGLKGAVQYLGRDQRLQEEKGNYLELMEDEINRIDRIVENLQSFARPQAPSRQPTALAELADSVLLLLEVPLGDANVQVIRSYNYPNLLPVDGEQIRQVLLNLFKNAIDAMETGGTLTVSIDEDGNGVLVQVSDSGPGIAPEILDRIWHPFQTTKEQGSGLGLSVVHGIITAHRGIVDVETSSRGTIFSIWLPKEVKE